MTGRGRVPAVALVALLAPCVPALAGPPATTALELLLGRARAQAERFLPRLSDVECVEEVHQQKLDLDGKVLQERAATYHYLLILSNAGGQLTVDESREPIAMPEDEKGPPLLVSNGFAMLFLVFHPYYSGSFEFGEPQDEVVEGRTLTRVAFQHVRDTRSPAALSLRGREFPLELAGTAWLDPATGALTRMVAGVGDSMADVGLAALRVEVVFRPAPFEDPPEPFWYPAEARVEVETQHQHWRNVHQFANYRRFSVSTIEQVATR